MSHALTINAAGKAAIAYVGETPWHSLGQQLTAGAPRETWREESGMNFEINEAFPRYATGYDQDSTSWRKLTDSRILFRSDTGDALGFVSARFKVVQPADILDTMIDWCDQSGMTMDTAGTLHGGKKFWALAKIGAETYIKDKRDQVGGFLLLATACDGSMATIAKKTSVRVVCQNTLNFAVGARGQKADVKISHRSTFDASAMADELGLSREQFHAWAQTMRLLANERVTHDKASQILVEAITGKTMQEMKAGEVNEAQDRAAFKRMIALFEGEARGDALDGVHGTAWGLVNACTEFLDHQVRATSRDNRLESAWFGPGEKMKARVLELLTA